MKSLKVTCPCKVNSFTIITSDQDQISPRDLQGDNWRQVGGLWRCWSCMGLPMPAILRQAIADAEAVECGEDPYSDEDPENGGLPQ